MPESRVTSTSTVGLPRESRISRARTLSITACRAMVMAGISIVRARAWLWETGRVLARWRRRWDTDPAHEAEPACQRTFAHPHAAPDLRLSRSVRRRSGPRQAHHRHCRVQPPQALRTEDHRAKA